MDSTRVLGDEKLIYADIHSSLVHIVIDTCRLHV
jgi:hypothetical protein